MTALPAYKKKLSDADKVDARTMDRFRKQVLLFARLDEPDLSPASLTSTPSTLRFRSEAQRNLDQDIFQCREALNKVRVEIDSLRAWMATLSEQQLKSAEPAARLAEAAKRIEQEQEAAGAKASAIRDIGERLAEKCEQHKLEQVGEEMHSLRASITGIEKGLKFYRGLAKHIDIYCAEVMVYLDRRGEERRKLEEELRAEQGKAWERASKPMGPLGSIWSKIEVEDPRFEPE